MINTMVSLRIKSDGHVRLLEGIIKSEAEGDQWWEPHNPKLTQDIFDNISKNTILYLEGSI